jgi:hypothetical protein
MHAEHVRKTLPRSNGFMVIRPLPHPDSRNWPVTWDHDWDQAVRQA